LCGNLGADARHFVDFLVSAGQTVWQMLPLGVPHDDGSPYQCLSVYAGNPALISPESLCDWGWLSVDEYSLAMQQIRDVVPVLKTGQQDLQGACQTLQAGLLEQARSGFMARANDEERALLAAFIEQQSHWLNDYALYQSLHQHFHHQSWVHWPQPLRDREPDAVAEARLQFADQIDEVCFEQFVFFRQWQALKDYANQNGVLMFGDMPIFIAADSADVWCARDYFDLDAAGEPRTVTGVPPDYFSDTGQRWGNPHYRWDVMAADDFNWWKQRLAMQLQLFDVLRVDHFRGFEASWEIPADHETAIGGCWVPVPGKELFDCLLKHFVSLPLVAEDLGIITPAVEALRDRYHFPGMKILQFAFGGDSKNPYLPHNHEQNSIVYTGTHDNDTTLGWYLALDKKIKSHVHEYLDIDSDNDMPWPLIKSAMESVACTAIFPMQDILGLDSSHRMNIPGTTQGNWRWRFDWQSVPVDLAQRLRHLTELYQRLP
jgi:4-alpha-glucanotransferase